MEGVMGPVFGQCEAATVFRPQRILAHTFVMATAQRLLRRMQQASVSHTSNLTKGFKNCCGPLSEVEPCQTTSRSIIKNGSIRALNGCLDTPLY